VIGKRTRTFRISLFIIIYYFRINMNHSQQWKINNNSSWYVIVHQQGKFSSDALTSWFSKTTYNFARQCYC
jgi:hypothetical protein